MNLTSGFIYHIINAEIENKSLNTEILALTGFFFAIKIRLERGKRRIGLIVDEKP